MNAAVVERGPVLAEKGGKLFCLVVLELEGEGRSLVKVEALDTLLHWVPGCKFSLPASNLRPLPSSLDWDHTALLGPLHLLHIPDGTRIKIIKSEQIGQVLQCLASCFHGVSGVQLEGGAGGSSGRADQCEWVDLEQGVGGGGESKAGARGGRRGSGSLLALLLSSSSTAARAET